jgi:hypothetical protein
MIKNAGNGKADKSEEIVISKAFAKHHKDHLFFDQKAHKFAILNSDTCVWETFNDDHVIGLIKDYIENNPHFKTEKPTRHGFYNDVVKHLKYESVWKTKAINGLTLKNRFIHYETQEIETPRPDVRDFIDRALLFAGVFFATRLPHYRLSRSPLNLTPLTKLGQFGQTEPGLCFASSSMSRGSLFNTGRDRGSLSIDTSSSRPPQSVRMASPREVQSRAVGAGQFIRELSPTRNSRAQRGSDISVLTTQASAIQDIYITSDEIDEVTIISYRKIDWYMDKLIITEGSVRYGDTITEMVERSGEVVPNTTDICFHLQCDEKLILKANQYGTLAEYRFQNKIKGWLRSGYLKVNNVTVKLGDQKVTKNEHDHIILQTAASIFNLRHPDRNYDRSLTVHLPKIIHAIRTRYYHQNQCKFPIDNFTAPLEAILAPIRQNDEALWLDPRYREAILAVGLIPEEVNEKYRIGYEHEVERARNSLQERGFDPRQATAYALNERIKDAIITSREKFVFFEPSVSLSYDETASIISQFNPTQCEAIQRNYLKKMRIVNLENMCTHFSKLIKLSHTLELYSQSAAGIEDGCNENQTIQHQQTIIDAINGFVEGLQRGKIPEAEAREAVNHMLTLANFNRDGTSQGKEWFNPEQLTNEQTRTLLKRRLDETESGLNINDLHKKGGVINLMKPIQENRKKTYMESRKEVRSGEYVPSIWTHQQSLNWPQLVVRTLSQQEPLEQEWSESESYTSSQQEFQQFLGQDWAGLEPVEVSIAPEPGEVPAADEAFL